MKPGDIARVKISGEPVFVLEVPDGLEGEALFVRRAKVTQNGIEYVTTQLHGDEVESVEDSIDREFAEVLYRHKLSSGKSAKAEIELDVEPGIVQ